MEKKYFLKMIQHLRVEEQVMLYGNLFETSSDEEEVCSFLQTEYQQESLTHPFQSPSFDGAAALWGARLIYNAAQLLLYRQNKPNDLIALFPDFQNEVTPSAIVSADLCLRFLPDVIAPLRLIDGEDQLIGILENHLKIWHFSAVKSELSFDALDFTLILSNPCIKRLYVDRVIEYKKLKLAFHPSLKPLVQASLGMYADVFWNNFKTELLINE
ncbi:hypothetical protein [Pinibacter soli]|uniref:MoxR-vWA-beta-propeller ternary system domain-containing protein n=1 Tax=Pinibacter soli TaxID=3044211 RepID=A0ABT6RBU2_9BACT|nr:hypothetical protein [Pinibacter soli]MDI3319394.1 hypothetical protein [Pinibacter soli]